MIGQTLGHYKILDKLGAGGMGEVYRAEDTNLKRQVALKVLPPDLADSQERLDRFQREAETLAALDHPNIVHIYSVEEAAGVRFLTMQLVEGKRLSELIPAGGLTLERIFDVAVPLADALAAAHEKGVVHRDLKPGNIMVTNDGRVKVLDFGLAKLRQDHLGPEATEMATEPLTGEGSAMGTAPYMSPEQVQGKEVDHRSDIFSLGIVFYELATGARPFRGETSADVVSSILRDSPASVSELKQDLPRHLGRIIRHCLEKDPIRRYQSVLDVRNELEALQGEVESGELSATAAIAAPPPKGVGTKWLLAAVATVALVAALAVIWLLARPGTGPSRALTSIAVLPFENTSGDPETEYLSDGLTESLINQLSPLPDLKVMARSTAFRYKQSSLDPQQIGSELDVMAVLVGRVDQRGEDLIVGSELIDVADGTQIWGERYRRKLADLLVVEEELARGIADQLRPQLIGETEVQVSRRPTRDAEAYRLYLQGRYHWNKRTPEGIRRGLDHFEQAIEVDPLFALAWTGVADSHTVGSGYYLGLPSREAYPRARAAALEALELDDSLAEAHASLAGVLFEYDWDWQGAEKEFQNALRLNPGYATAHQWYAEFLYAMGRHEEAFAEIDRALELDPLNLIMNNVKGWALVVDHRYDEAIAQFRRTLEIEPEFTLAQLNLAFTMSLRGHSEGLLEEWIKAARLAGANDAVLADMTEIFEAGGATGLWRFQAETLTERSREGRISIRGLVSSLAQSGQTDRAIDLLEEAYRDRASAMAYIKTDPRLDPLRSDPRFQVLLNRMNFPD